MTPLDLLVILASGAIVYLCISAFFAVLALQSIARGDWLDRPLKTPPFGFTHPDVESLLKPAVSIAPSGSPAPVSPLAFKAAEMIVGLTSDDRTVHEVAWELERKPELVTIIPLCESLRARTYWSGTELWSNRSTLLEYQKAWGPQAEQYAVEAHDTLRHRTGATPSITQALGDRGRPHDAT